MWKCALLLACALALPAQHEDKSEKKPKNPAIGNPEAIAAGQKLFMTSCAGCHGPTGDGGRGPNLRERGAWHSLDDDGMFTIVNKGVPGSDMPALNRPENEIWQIVAFVRSLTAPAMDSNAPGDVEAGKQIFWGKMGCSNCHMIGAKGGFLGPDLSNIGAMRSLNEIRNSILDPSERGVKEYQPVHITFRKGGTLDGVCVDRTNYAMQVIDRAGKVHRIAMNDVEAIVLHKKSAMPGDYKTRLSRDELRDLLAYLSRQSTRPPDAKSEK
ncbi:MAG TPA: c-type cytochrome [Bryobacteraceae bacterium]|nr:c-type cytochrome [Bryobacteraceae bacterium]